MSQMSQTNPSVTGAPAAPDAASAPALAGAAAGELSLQIEAILMTTDRALPSARLSELLGKVGSEAVNGAIKALNDVYDSTGRSFRIEAVAGGWQILTLPRFRGVLEALHRSREQTHLSPAAMETLAIIAYKQPVLRAQVESIRGVASGEVIRSLMERKLVKIVGRAEELGRPMLYGTTRAFLEVFGLASLKDLPKVEEFKPKATARLAPREATAQAASDPPAPVPKQESGDASTA
jgi:segregation and condensation protein B